MAAELGRVVRSISQSSQRSWATLSERSRVRARVAVTRRLASPLNCSQYALNELCTLCALQLPVVKWCEAPEKAFVQFYAICQYNAPAGDVRHNRELCRQPTHRTFGCPVIPPECGTPSLPEPWTADPCSATIAWVASFTSASVEQHEPVGCIYPSAGMQRLRLGGTKLS